jgi:hypothetical protein
MQTLSIIRDIFAAIGFASVMTSLSIVAVASLGAWMETEDRPK